MANENNAISDIVKKCKILLLDIEGTTTTISFVKDKLFPYAEENVKDFLTNQWEDGDVKDAVAALRKLALEDKEKSVEGVVTIPGQDASKEDQIEALVKSVRWLMSSDRKVEALIQLQGLIWKQGYDKGDIKGHVYDDVSPALDQWRSVEGQKVYSSGSVQAQKLLFNQSLDWDMLKRIDGHFNTTVGAKQEAVTYTAIAEKIGYKPEEILFLTDVVNEAEAARSSGMQSALVSREGNAPLPADAAASFPVLYSLATLANPNSRKPDAQSQDSTSGNEIKVFCPKCNTEVSHTAEAAEGIQEDKTKILLAKVYHYFEQEYEELKNLYGDQDLTPLSKFCQRTALATGVSETTLLQILKEEEERNADKRREPPQKRRAARKRRRQTDSSSEEDSSDDNDDEQPSYVDDDGPEIFLPTEVKIEPCDGDISSTNETLELDEPADSKRKGRKIPRINDDTSTRQHTHGESSAPVASSSVPLPGTLLDSRHGRAPIAASRRRPRTRGPRRGGRVRVRGGRAAAVEMEEVVAVVAADRGATRRGRGRGLHHERPGPYNIENLNVRDGEDMPEGQGLETPLHPRRERRWPSSDLAQEEPAAPPSPASIIVVPSPASLAVCPLVPASPFLSPPPAPRHSLQFLQDVRIYDINYGSDLSSEESDDEDSIALGIPRVLQSAMETPLDVDEEGVDEPAVGPAPAELDNVPPTATDKPRRWYDFEWKEFPNSPIAPASRRETFSENKVGPTTPRDDPYDIFVDIWDRPIMEHIASETNKYAQQLAAQMMANNSLRPNSRISRWCDTTVDELYVYFGLILAMGVVVKSRLEEYWASTPDIFYTPGFSAHMSIDRFLLLSKCLHFNDNDSMCGLDLDASEARLFKIKPILSHLNNKFQAMYTPAQNISLDESLLMWKGWLEINQLISNKTAKIGIKTYEICESQTGYLWRFEVHSHKKSLSPLQQFENPLDAPTPSIVLRLTQGLEHKGYTLWMDNYYNSPCLARRLKSLGFDCVGTLRTDRKFVPQALHNLTKQNMSKGQIAGLTSGDVDVMVWRDNNRVAMISTYHGNAVRTFRGSTKPILILDYNIMMGGVDKKDQLLAMYPVERKRTMVWYKKLFRRLLNVSVLNSFVIHRHCSPSSSLHRSFRIKVIKSLLSRHRPLPINPYPATAQNGPSDESSRPFLATVHRLDEYLVVPSPSGGDSRRPRRKCVVCKSRVSTFCVGCKKTMCLKNCFLSHHS